MTYTIIKTIVKWAYTNNNQYQGMNYTHTKSILVKHLQCLVSIKVRNKGKNLLTDNLFSNTGDEQWVNIHDLIIVNPDVESTTGVCKIFYQKVDGSYWDYWTQQFDVILEYKGTLPELKNEGFTLSELKEVVELSKLINEYPLSELRTEFALAELIENYTLFDLETIGSISSEFVNEIEDWTGISDDKKTLLFNNIADWTGISIGKTGDFITLAGKSIGLTSQQFVNKIKNWTGISDYENITFLVVFI